MNDENMRKERTEELDNIAETYVRVFYGLLSPELLRPEKEAKADAEPEKAVKFRGNLLNNIAESCFASASYQPYTEFSPQEFKYIKQTYMEKIKEQISHELVSKYLSRQEYLTDTTIEKLLENIDDNLTRYQLKVREDIIKIINSDSQLDIYNKKYFKEALSASINGLDVKNYKLDLIFIDIDHFKSINDKYSHSAGDFILNKIAGLLNSLTRKTDIPARYGGDEFTVLIRYDAGEGALGFAKRLMPLIKEPFRYEGNEIKVTLSMGIAKYEQDTHDLLIEKADKALYQVKEKGRNGINIYGSDEIIRI